MLATEYLEKIFGKIDLEIIFQNDSVRKSVMKDKNGRFVAYNLVFFTGKNKFPAIHNKIAKGGKIGETFKSKGYEVIRDEKCCFLYTFPKKLREIAKETKGWVKYLILKATKNNVTLPYCSIIEIYPSRVNLESFETEKNSKKTAESLLNAEFNG